MKTRKTYTKEFKLDAVSLVVEQNYTVAEAARSLDINSNMLGRWIKEQENEGEQAFRGNGKLTPEQEEIRQLREENKRLKMEKKILKNCLTQIHGIGPYLALRLISECWTDMSKWPSEKHFTS